MCRITALLTADGADFTTRPVTELVLTLAGIVGDRHAGAMRRADARTPWHQRGTSIANTRQLSIVSAEECDEIADILDVPSVDPTLLGANLMVEGLARFSLLAPASRLICPSGATIFITEQNAPCRHPAEKLAEAYDRPRLAAAFARAAIGRRGLVGIVEREGRVAVGDAVTCVSSPALVSSPKVAVPTRV